MRLCGPATFYRGSGSRSQWHQCLSRGSQDTWPLGKSASKARRNGSISSQEQRSQPGRTWWAKRGETIEGRDDLARGCGNSMEADQGAVGCYRFRSSNGNVYDGSLEVYDRIGWKSRAACVWLIHTIDSCGHDHMWTNMFEHWRLMILVLLATTFPC